MENSQRSLRMALVALFWLCLTVALYFVYHKPFSAPVAFAFASAFWRITVAATILSLAGGLGIKILPWLSGSPMLRMCLQVAFGMGVVSLAILITGSSVGFSIWLWGAGLFVLAFLLRRDIRAWMSGWKDLLALWREGGRLGRTIAAGLVIILFFTFCTALAPPLKFDALVYHLSLVNGYLANGKITYIPENMFWGMPQNAEMLFSWASLLGGNEAAVTLGWGTGLLALAGVLAYSAGCLGARSAWVSVASLMSGFTLAASLAWGYVDWQMILFGLSFLVAIDHWEKQGQGLWLAGAFAGFAIGTKYTAGILWFSGIIYLFYFSVKRDGWREAILTGLSFTFWVGLFLAPWLIKNILATGNPFYPLLFPAGAMDRMRLDLYQAGSAWGNWLDVFLLPVRATALGVEMAPGYSASIGPLLLGLSVAAWLGWKHASLHLRRSVGIAGWISATGLLIWMIIGRFSSYLLQTRLYLALFPAFTVLAGAGFKRLENFRLPGVRLGRLAGALVIIAFFFCVLETTIFTLKQGSPQVLLGIHTSKEYLENNLGWYTRAMERITQLPTGTRVLMLWEPRSLYCVPVCIPDEVLDRWLRDRDRWLDSTNILESWRKMGYTYLLVNMQGVDFLRDADLRYHPDDWRVLDEMLQTLPAPENFGDGYALYRITQ